MKQLLSVNVGTPQTVNWGGHAIRTAIFKQPVEAPRFLSEQGLPGDRQADARNHGGPDKAALVYPAEHYQYWSIALQQEFSTWGQFGETLTISQVDERGVRIGDRLKIGQCLVEVSQPRTPCLKLAIRLQLPDFPKRYQASSRVGFYVRVLQPGQVQSGDRVTLIPTSEASMTVAAVSRLLHEGGTAELLQQAIDLPALASCWRTDFQNRLAQIQANASAEGLD